MRRRRKNPFQVGSAPLAVSVPFCAWSDGDGGRRRRRLVSATSVLWGQRDSAPASLRLSLSLLFLRHRDCHYLSLPRVRPSDVDGRSGRVTDAVDAFLRKF